MIDMSKLARKTRSTASGGGPSGPAFACSLRVPAIVVFMVTAIVGPAASGQPMSRFGAPPEGTTFIPGSTGQQLEPYTEQISGTLVSFAMIPVPVATVTRIDPQTGEPDEIEGDGFWIGRTEVTWEELDVWMLGLDVEPAQRAGIDADSRPSRPYGAPDRGFGHAGFAAISLTLPAAQQYTAWLSEKTGRSYRLPTGREWQLACEIGAAGLAGDAAAPNPGYLDAHAWHRGNSDRATHAAASKQPDALGLFDMLGNAAEWATNPAGEPVLHGGSYRDEPEVVHCGARAPQAPAWNSTDPQIPKSTWWLSDGPFAGFRVVRDGRD